jgi:hypothetical protein
MSASQYWRLGSLQLKGPKVTPNSQIHHVCHAKGLTCEAIYTTGTSLGTNYPHSLAYTHEKVNDILRLHLAWQQMKVGQLRVGTRPADPIFAENIRELALKR